MQAGPVRRSDHVGARFFGKNFEVANDLPTGEPERRDPVAGRKHIHLAAVDDKKGIAGVAGMIKDFTRVQMPDPGEFTDGSELRPAERGTKSKEIPLRQCPL